uniref:Putative ovule protein n=1 Tax=Solanum chacoense TaxID=4108 RepID=A0A0V0I871_SOLCH
MVLCPLPLSPFTTFFSCFAGGMLLSQRALKLRRTKYDLAASEKCTPSFIAIRSLQIGASVYISPFFSSSLCR